MGGIDKGLKAYRGVPLALHALQRLAPQVGATMINANRHLDVYAGFGAPVWPDVQGDYPGPLAGFLAGLDHCDTPWLVTVPCDSPNFPLDLMVRLSDALTQSNADIAMAATVEAGFLQVQPVFCLMRVMLIDSLRDFMAGGQRKIDRWTAQHHCIEVAFDDAEAFANANTLDELHRLEAP
jgi:molybdopterin-guanine dinucleotide biosynthesis protein A